MSFKLLVLLALLSLQIQAQQIQNLRFEQSGKQIHIYYDLSGTTGESYDVQVFLSQDGGRTFSGPLQKVSGALGYSTNPGNGKVINWDVLAERDKLEGEIMFELRALASSVNGTVKDVDGNIYKTVKIGTQTWMAENLKTTKYKDGNSIPNVIDNSVWVNLTRPAYCWFDNDIENKATLGALYNWHAVNTGKLCPAGWHVPSNAEWTQMENYLADNGYNYDGTTGGGGSKISKSLASTSGWPSSSSTGSVGNNDYPAYRNKSGFTALPGGYRGTGGSFSFIGGIGGLWSSTELNTVYAWFRLVDFGKSYVNSYDFDKQSGFSVRCLRD